jgi:prepilin-type N-terminal cleavage/methylation domain-containing protein
MHTTSENKSVLRSQRDGFTLIELLVVIAVILTLVVTTLPAFRSIQKSGRVSGAINALSSALETARAMAVRDGRDVAVMVRFDEKTVTTSLEFLQMDSIVYDADRQNGGMNAATVFVPYPGLAPMELPKGAGVFGYGYGASRGNVTNKENWYPDLGLLYRYNGPTGRDPWLFPRTDFKVFDEESGNIDRLETFIIRFSPDGTIVTNAEELGSLARGGDAFYELDDRDDPGFARWNPRVLNSGNLTEPGVFPEYQLRAVPMVIVVDLYQMGDDLGIREPWRVLGDGYPSDRKDANESGREDQYEIDDWITVHTTPIAFNRYTGEMMRDVKR